MKNKGIVFVCESCGTEFSKWQGMCPSCNEWNSIVETISTNTIKKTYQSTNLAPTLLSKVPYNIDSRLKTGLPELDRVLDRGFVHGQIVLLAGSPGVGKSTLLLEMLNKMDKKALYISAEESKEQVRSRADRLKIVNSNIYIDDSNCLDNLLNSNESYEIIVVDSIQSIYTQNLNSRVGSVSQIRECANMLLDFGKKKGIPVIIVGHITKEGDIAGPKLLEHLVDTVFYLEGDQNNFYRILRVNKNRYGDSSEVGIFKMDADGLKSVDSIGSSFVNEETLKLPGNILSMALSGSRPMLIEVQSLSIKTSFGYPRRTITGYSLTRLNLLCAIIQKRLSLNLLDKDIYVNLVSGFNVKDTSLDLAICLSIVSSFKNKSLSGKFVAFGEVGLSGEIRPVISEEKRLKELALLGYKDFISSQNLKNIVELARFLV